MKSKRHFLTALLVSFTAAHHATGQAPPAMPVQAQASFTRVSDTDCNLNWQGVSGRTYFIQTSVDLVHWEYDLVMTFGVGLWQSVIRSTSQKYFVRLHYVDDSTVTTVQEAKDADFDGDGISNYDEITRMRTDPFRFATNGGMMGDGAQDWDSDGVSNADELALGLDPGVNNTTPTAGATTVGYTYDDVHRLINITAPLSTETFSPDAEGNLE